MGGSSVEVATPVRRQSDHLGLDWFLINLLILATVFVPLESVFARLPAQRRLRRGWTTDLAHFCGEPPPDSGQHPAHTRPPRRCSSGGR